MDELKRASSITIKDIGWAMAEHTKIYRNTEKFFEDYDLLITPAASVPPFFHEEEYPKKIDDIEMENYLKWKLSLTVTLLEDLQLSYLVEIFKICHSAYRLYLKKIQI